MKNEIMKFRVAASDKARLVRAASLRNASISSLLRRAAHLVIQGRADDQAFRADMAEVRRLANAINAVADRFAAGDATAASDARLAGAALRRLAAVHLDASP
jgi:hypothetical protein